MHDDRQITEQRLRRFQAERLEPAEYREALPLSVTAWVTPGEPVPFGQAVRGRYTPLAPGTDWGAPWGTTWLHVTGRVPPAWGHARVLPGDVRVEALVDLGFDRASPGFQAEGLAYDSDGNPLKTIAPRNSHLSLALGAGDEINFFVEAASNPNVAAGAYHPTPLGDPATAGSVPLYRLGRVQVALLDVAVWELLRDVEVLDGLMRELPADRPRRAMILRALERMLDAMDPDDIAGTALAGRSKLAGVLASPASASAHHVVAVGHAHIDSAWLWPVRETVRKCARTFSNVLSLMDGNPDFVFACSSAQQFAWIKEFYPTLFERIRAKVAAGQFVPVGGMWVESDTNMPGGEAVVRQFLMGKRFFLDEFGVDTEEVWLPDSFGYSGALPQIAAGAGARWFLTQKISWNQTNRMPHHTFRWQGIDGTSLFTHFPPVDTYNSDLSASDLAHAERNYAEHGLGSMSLVPFGHGDGGGGPTREMIARGRRVRSLEGSPTLSFGSARQFFLDAEQDYPDPPVWVGEMYLELHRGTYTSQARTKRGNRRSEHLLREAELWAATAAVRTGSKKPGDYPYDEFERLWRIVLLQQFHDILPGSSIAWVHREAERRYAEVAQALERLIQRSLRDLAGLSDNDDNNHNNHNNHNSDADNNDADNNDSDDNDNDDNDNDNDNEIAFNASPFPRDGVPGLGAGPSGPDPAAPEVRVVQDGDGTAGPTRGQTGGRTAGLTLDNGLVRVSVDHRGLLTSLVDLASGRDAVPPGAAGNLLQVHRDIPNQWDAWDIDRHYRDTVTDLDTAESVSLIGAAPGHAAIEVRRTFGESVIAQRISLSRGSRSVQIITEVDWHERQKLLKLAFPVDVAADRSASETQFGHVFRATHTNTSWEAAKFEVCAHRWIHVAEPGFGVAIANDATYGHDVTPSPRAGGGTSTTVRLSLLRAPLYPDPDADQGAHTFGVSVTPGAQIGDAVRAGYELNLPIRTVRGSREVPPIVTVSHPAVVVEAVKLAEDRSGDVIVRLYESLGRRLSVTVDAGFDAAGVTVTDLLERPLEQGPQQQSTLRQSALQQSAPSGSDIGREGGRIGLSMRPFELVTLRLARRG